MKSNLIETLIQLLLDCPELKTVTQYLSKTSVVRVTRQHKHSKRSPSKSYVVSIGKPNYEARQFIKLCVKAKEPFPVLKPQFKFYPKK